MRETAEHTNKICAGTRPSLEQVIVGGIISTVALLLEEGATCLSARARAICHMFVGNVLEYLDISLTPRS